MVKHQNLCIFVALLTQQHLAAPTSKRQCGPNKDGILCLTAGGGFTFSFSANEKVQKCELSAWSEWGNCRQLGNTCQKIQTRIRQCSQVNYSLIFYWNEIENIKLLSQLVLDVVINWKKRHQKTASVEILMNGPTGAHAAKHVALMRYEPERELVVLIAEKTTFRSALIT